MRQRPSEKLNLLDQMIHELVKRFYVSSSPNGPGAEFSSGELFACGLLGRKGRCTMSHLAQECGLPLSTMTGVVDRLLAKGCVKRSRDDERDRRRVFVELDRKGEEVYQERLESEMRTIITMMESLKAKEQDALLGTLGKAVASLKK